MKIIGAGLSGLLAANLFQRAEVFEAGSEEQVNHKAVLRFRSSAFGDAVGIEFRKVVVRKGVWSDGGFTEPTIQLANFYSNKVVGKLMDRSIWNLAPVERFVAPRDLVAQMVAQIGSRIHWKTPVASRQELSGPIISTIPMPVLAKMLHAQDAPRFDYAPIFVQRFTVPDADVFQTVYFPEEHLNVYRASITGDLLIVESVRENEQVDLDEVFAAFGLQRIDPVLVDRSKQSYGKIAPIDDAWRRRFILNATIRHDVYSLGRFATWRNVLLDDVVKDCAVIKRLLSLGAYAATRHA